MICQACSGISRSTWTCSTPTTLCQPTCQIHKNQIHIFYFAHAINPIMGIFREYMSYTQFQYSYILQGSFCFEPFQLFWGSLLWPTLTHFFIVFHSESLKGCPDSLLARVSGLSPPSETNFLTTFCLKAQFDKSLCFCAAFECNR